MKQEIKELEINGVVYAPKSDAQSLALAPSLEGLPYVLVRTYSAGVHIGYLKKREGQEVILLNSRNIWSWVGASGLSQLSQDGVLQPSADGNKFTVEVPERTLIQAIEIIPISAKAKINFDSIKPWKK